VRTQRLEDAADVRGLRREAELEAEEAEAHVPDLPERQLRCFSDRCPVPLGRCAHSRRCVACLPCGNAASRTTAKTAGRTRKTQDVKRFFAIRPLALHDWPRSGAVAVHTYSSPQRPVRGVRRRVRCGIVAPPE